MFCIILNIKTIFRGNTMSNYDLTKFNYLKFTGAMLNIYGPRCFTNPEMVFEMDLNKLAIVDGRESITVPYKVSTLHLDNKITDLFGSDFVSLVFVGEAEIQLFNSEGIRTNVITPITENNELKGYYAVQLDSFSNGKGSALIKLSDFDVNDNGGNPIIETTLRDIHFTQSWIAGMVRNASNDFTNHNADMEALNNAAFMMGHLKFEAIIQNKDKQLPQEPIKSAPITAKDFLHAVLAFNSKYPDCTILSVNQL